MNIVKKKHSYKLKNNLEIKYKVVAFKDGNGPWTSWTSSEPETPEPGEVVASETQLNLDEEDVINLPTSTVADRPDRER